MHFCAGLPIILVGCKKDLRREQKVLEELKKTNQRPVTPEEVSYGTRDLCPFSNNIYRVWQLRRRLVHVIILNAQPAQEKVYVRFSNTPHALPSFPHRAARRRVALLSKRISTIGFYQSPTSKR